MKKTITWLMLALFILASFITGCGSSQSQNNQQTSGKLKIVATTFPVYDWAREIIKDKDVELTLLLDSGIDLHNYQPSANDILKIAQSDVFIYVGGESDEWVEGALKQSPNPKRVEINLMEKLGDKAKDEAEIEGAEHHHHNHEEGKHHDEEKHHKEHKNEHHEEHEKDEHIWLSLKNAQILVDAIAEALEKADTKNANAYKNNAKEYKTKLAMLDNAYTDAVKHAKIKTILFGDRFPFLYLMEDYGIKYYAAFSGCSAETEASFETIAFLAKKLDENHLPAVLTIEGNSHKIAESIISASESKSAKILSMDSLQTTTDKTSHYFDIMRKNREVLMEALGFSNETK